MTPVRVLLVHNAYQQSGGEDSVVQAELALLHSRGHAVETYFRDNDDIVTMSRIGVAARSLWSAQTTQDVGALIERFAPDVMHVHNTLPLISPSIYWAAARAGVPVVQTMHNFRLLCPQALLLRNGKVCELCVGRVPFPAIRYGCYRSSRAQTAVLSGMLMLHRAIGTWTDKVSRYIALNEFCRDKFIEGGLPAARIVVKPNFVDFDTPPMAERCGFLYVGRLSTEKGVDVLAGASGLASECEVAVAGTGPDDAALDGLSGVRRLGVLSGALVRERMCGAVALILPSICYENFPRTLVEAFACGLPLIASRIGSLAHLVEEGVTGLLFEPGSPEDLAQKMRWARANPERMAQMGRNARAHYEANFTAERNYQLLTGIYADVIRERKRQTRT